MVCELKEKPKLGETGPAKVAAVEVQSAEGPRARPPAAVAHGPTPQVAAGAGAGGVN